jgi:hypothetical protein
MILPRNCLEGVRENLYVWMNYNIGAVSQGGGIPIEGMAKELDQGKWDEIVKDYFLIS